MEAIRTRRGASSIHELFSGQEFNAGTSPTGKRFAAGRAGELLREEGDTTDTEFKRLRDETRAGSMCTLA